MANQRPAARAYTMHCWHCIDCTDVDSNTRATRGLQRCETGKVLVRAAAEEYAFFSVRETQPENKANRNG